MSYAKIKELLDIKLVTTQVYNNGKVIIISNFHDEHSTNIEIWGSVYESSEWFKEVKNFKQRVIFPETSKKDIHQIIDKEEEFL